ncbi:MAG TPA: hypothetical protein VMV26_01625 [Alphaproteobacteria bacterium]|nr:hypothetical protein [Alphaproteobacteria bacterium]
MNLRSVTALVAIGLAALLALPAASRAEQQPQLSPEVTKQFVAFRNSKDYIDALLAAVMEQDQRLWPSCDTRKPISRTLVEIIKPPQFGKDGKQPTAGFWGERVELDRCGTRGAQTVYFDVKDKINLAPGLPGRTLANLYLQVDTGKAVIDADLKKEKTCTAREIVDSAVLTPPPSPGAPWVERWTVAACGVLRPHDVTFTPKPDGDITFAVATPKS